MTSKRSREKKKSKKKRHKRKKSFQRGEKIDGNEPEKEGWRVRETEDEKNNK